MSYLLLPTSNTIEIFKKKQIVLAGQVYSASGHILNNNY